MSHWNGYAYDSASATKVRRTRRDRKCVHCGGIIRKGEPYTNWNGYPGFAEHEPECPPKADPLAKAAEQADREAEWVMGCEEPDPFDPQKQAV